uniref:Uncharacterized protein n=1 Tax=Lactuca sativa TaxID=4236 RepID=A0A9R1XBV4_LACSA|nr:hypothetical protein LSAT_V11C500246030 [Lactuca sativa]
MHTIYLCKCLTESTVAMARNFYLMLGNFGSTMTLFKTDVGGNRTVNGLSSCTNGLLWLTRLVYDSTLTWSTRIGACNKFVLKPTLRHSRNSMDG